MPDSRIRGVHAGQHEFCENLRMLCTYYRSVADVCRKLNVNRAQFNRYLNGTSKPSSHTLERICDFFGVEPAEIYLPREHFHQIIQVRPKQRTERAIYVEPDFFIPAEPGQSGKSVSRPRVHGAGGANDATRQRPGCPIPGNCLR